MKTIDKIISQHENSGIREIECGYEYWQVEDAMREYALEIIKEIMEAEAQCNLYSGACVNAVASEWVEKVKNQIR